VLVEGGGVVSYPEWTKSQLLLLLLWNKLQEAYDEGESELRLFIRRGGPDAGIEVGYPEAVKVSDEIPELSRGGEAVAVFDRLFREGYVLVGFDSQDRSFEATTPVLYGLSTEGMIDIGKFPDPDERLARAFEVARDLLAQEGSVPPDKKRDMLDTMENVASLLNNVGGLGQLVGRAVAEGLGPGPGVG
jgi:hypothetical protein